MVIPIHINLQGTLSMERSHTFKTKITVTKFESKLLFYVITVSIRYSIASYVIKVSVSSCNYYIDGHQLLLLY